ncbi:MAG: hypothetical protein IJ062_10010 [Firmicutes bacterium]|nr:hypothetical protein [Bacillota bacterium]
MANRQRSERISLRLRPDEKEMLQKKMAQCGYKSYIEMVMAAIKRPVTVKIDLMPLFNIINELNHILVNLRQIEKVCKQNGVDCGVIDDMTGKINEMLNVTHKVTKIFQEVREGALDGIFKDIADKDNRTLAIWNKLHNRQE